MTTAADMNTLAGLAETIIDGFLGGHADTDLVKLFNSSGYLWNIMNGTVSHKIVMAFIAQLIDKVFDLEA